MAESPTTDERGVAGRTGTAPADHDLYRRPAPAQTPAPARIPNPAPAGSTGPASTAPSASGDAARPTPVVGNSPPKAPNMHLLTRPYVVLDDPPPAPAPSDDMEIDRSEPVTTPLLFSLDDYRGPDSPEPVTAPPLTSDGYGKRPPLPEPVTAPPAFSYGDLDGYDDIDGEERWYRNRSILGSPLVAGARPEGSASGTRRRRWAFGVALPVVAVTIGVAAILAIGPGSDEVTTGDRAGLANTAPGGRPGGEAGEPVVVPPAESPAIVPPAAAHQITAPLADREEATFDLVSGTTTSALRMADLGTDLFRITTTAGGSVLPRAVTEGDRVQLHLVPSGRSGPSTVGVQLNSRVRWQVRVTGGAVEHRLDLAGARLAGVELVGGATRVDLTLPEPSGTLTVRMTGGINQFAVHVPEGPPVQVRAGNGAASVTVDGDRRAGVAAGVVLTPAGWQASDDRFYLDLVAGVAALTVDRV